MAFFVSESNSENSENNAKNINAFKSRKTTVLINIFNSLFQGDSNKYNELTIRL